MRILVDMDDVLEQLLVGWTKYLNARYGTDVKVSDITEWNVTKAFPTLTREQVYGAPLDDEMWDLVPPMPGADEAIRQLINEGHEIYVVTASDWQTLPAKMEKVLFRYFPYIGFDHVIITKNKHIIKGDILIDDGPHNLEGGEYRKILFTAPHNLTFDEGSVGAVRVNSWSEALDAVHAIEKEII